MKNARFMYRAILVVLSCFAATSNAQSPIVTDATLSQVAASLQMYVEELSQLPKLYGYTTVGGVPKPATLTIGMYQTSWKFHRDLLATTVFVYSTSAATATVPGALQGVPTLVTWQNHLPQSHILPSADMPVTERTWKNVVKIALGYKTTLVVQFYVIDEGYAPYPFDGTPEPGYVYHCHILDHKDNAMIRPIKLVA